jgi:salicylate hydroxylase
MIYESSADIHAVGAGIVFGPNALRAMELIDPRLKNLYESIATGNGTREKENVFHDMLLAEPGFGFERAELALRDGGEEIRYEGFKKSGVHRAELMALMASFVPSENIRFGKRVVDLQQVDEQVRITFADGDSVEADAVVGCDGGKGVSRAAVLGDRYQEHVKAMYAGRYAYRTVVPMEIAREIMGSRYVEDGKMFMGRGCYFTTYPMSKGMQLNVLAARQRGEEWKCEGWTCEVSREEMLRDFEECDDRLVRLLEVSGVFPQMGKVRALTKYLNCCYIPINQVLVCKTCPLVSKSSSIYTHLLQRAYLPPR